MMQDLQFEPIVPASEGGINFVPEDKQPSVVGDTAKNRAFRYHIVLGDQSPGMDTLTSEIQNGNEPYWRQQVTDLQQRTKVSQRVQNFKDIVVNQNLTPEQASQLAQAYKTPINVNPNTAVEKGFADKYFEQVLQNRADSQSPQAQADQEDYEAASRIKKGANAVLARDEVIRRVLEDTQAKYQGQGWGSWTWNTAKGFVPFVNSAELSPDWNPANLVQPGTSMEQERNKFWAIKDLDQAEGWLRDRVATIAKSNVNTALQYAAAMHHLDMNDKQFMNIIGGLDVTSIPVIKGAKVAMGIGAKTSMLSTMLKDSLKGVKPSGEVTAASVATALGDIKTASQIETAQQALGKQTPGDAKQPLAARAEGARQTFMRADPTAAGAELRDQVKLITKPSSITGIDPEPVVQDRVNRLKPILQSSGDTIMKAIVDRLNVQRVPEELFPQIMTKTEEIMYDQYRYGTDAVLHTRNLYSPATNTYWTEHILGTKDGRFFSSQASAERFGYDELKLPHGSFAVSNEIPQGFEDVAKTQAADALKTPSKKTTTKNQPGTWNDKPVEVLPEAPMEDHAGRLVQKVIVDGKEKYVPAAELTYGNTTQQKLNQTITSNQLGNYWYISITKPWDETDPLIRSKMAIPTENKNPVTWSNFLLGALGKGAEDQLAYFQNAARHMATVLPNQIISVMKEMTKEITTLSKKELEDLNLILEHNKTYTESVRINGKMELVTGRAYSNETQLQRAWNARLGTLPTQAQSLAYWRYHQLMQGDWVMRNLGAIRDLYRQGVELFTIPHGQNKLTLPAIYKTEFPWDTQENVGVLVMGWGQSKHYWLNDLLKKPQEAEMIKAATGPGKPFRVLQNANPEDRRAIQEATGTNLSVHFIITPEFENTAMPMNIVDWNPGVHVNYPHPYYVSQPIDAVGEKGVLRHYGSQNIYPADSQKEATRIAEAIDEVRGMIKRNAPDADLDTFIARNLPEDTAYWKKQFAEEGRLSLDAPIGARSRNSSFYSANPQLKPDNKDLKLFEERNSQFNAFKAIDMDYLANRDAPFRQIVNVGTPQSPIYKTERARTLDPFQSLTRGLLTATDSLVINDAKYAAVEQWVAQQADAGLFRDNAGARANPYQAFYSKNSLRDDISGIDGRMQLSSARNTRERIMQFLGSASELHKDANIAEQWAINHMRPQEEDFKLSDTYKPLRWFDQRFYTDHELRMLKDPIGFTKSMLMHARFGLLNMAQFFVQGIGASNSFAIAGPVAGWKGLAGYFLTRSLNMTEHPDTINRILGIAEKMGWDRQQFFQAYETMNKSGWNIIGTEHSMDRGTFDPAVFKSKFNTALDIGKFPFTEGERLNREVGWYAAYHEWAKANPDKELNNFEISKILTRADTLAGNMTKASHGRLQEGVFAIPAQFYTFANRMMELYWGSRLTPYEKFRAFLTHSILFGVPITVGIGIPWPINDSVKQHLLETSSPLLDNGWYKAASEGLPGYMSEMIFGKGYNIEQRYGPGFGDKLKKFMEGDISAIELFGGAAGTFAKNLVKSVYPLYGHIYVAMKGGQEEYPLTKDDILGVMREASSVNNAFNAYYAMSTNKYFSRNGTLLANDMTTADAVAIVFGLTRRDIGDVNLTLGSMKDQKQAQERIMTLSKVEFQRASAYMQEDSIDWNKVDTHLARAKALMVAIGELTDNQINDVMKDALDNMPLKEKIRKDFTTKGYKSELPGRLQRLMEQN